MKSIEQLTQGIIAQSQAVSVVGNLPQLALPHRPAPLEPAEIEKITQSVSLCVKETRTPEYGYVPVLGEDGKLIRNEFDVVGYKVTFEPIAEMRQQLKEALARPAPKAHIVYHLTRLAAHRRDTRGEEALTAVIEDIAHDMFGVSEWAVIIACKEMRQKNTTWYPTTGEIQAIIRKAQEAVDELVGVKAKPTVLAIDDNRAGKRFDEVPKSKWLRCHYEQFLGHARTLLDYYRKMGKPGNVSQWEAQIAEVEAELREVAQ